MRYLLVGRDGTDGGALDRRLKARPEHLALAERMKAEGRLLYAVAILDDAGRMVGSMLVLDFDSREDLHQWLAVEPYMTGGVWKDVRIEPCQVGPAFATAPAG